MSLVSWVADLRFEFVFGGIRFKSNDHKQTVDLYLDILNQIQAINKNACHFGFRFPSLVRSFFKAHWFPLPTRSCFLSRFLSMQKSSLNHPKKNCLWDFFEGDCVISCFFPAFLQSSESLQHPSKVKRQSQQDSFPRGPNDKSQQLAAASSDHLVVQNPQAFWKKWPLHSQELPKVFPLGFFVRKNQDPKTLVRHNRFTC